MQPIPINESELRRLYLTENRNLSYIAMIYHCTPTTIGNRLRLLNIPLRGKSQAQKLRSLDETKKVKGRRGEENPNYRHGAFVQERIYRELISINNCSKCDSNKNLVVHHKNGNHYDNQLSNLEILCRKCHMSHHKKLYWENKRLSK